WRPLSVFSEATIEGSGRGVSSIDTVTFARACTTGATKALRGLEGWLASLGLGALFTSPLGFGGELFGFAELWPFVAGLSSFCFTSVGEGGGREVLVRAIKLGRGKSCGIRILGTGRQINCCFE